MLASILGLVLGQSTINLVPISTVRHPSVNEMSGIVRSNFLKGVYWTHNDSGDSARIWPMRLDGNVLKPLSASSYWVNAPVPGKTEWPGIGVTNATNVDWEDITIEGSTLYVADMGNNGNARTDLGIYVLTEPNPSKAYFAVANQFLPVRYPDQTAFPPALWHFDCEAVFARNGKLYAITKHRLGTVIPLDSAKLYRLDTTYTTQTNVLTKLDERGGLGGWVTGAAVSPSKQTLAVLCNSPVASVWFFDIRGTSEQWLNAPSRRVILQNARQAEAITFEDEANVIITNEQRDIFRVPVP